MDATHVLEVNVRLRIWGHCVNGAQVESMYGIFWSSRGGGLGD